jgi:hypothetical protein
MLTSCRECGKEVAFSAESCAHCGLQNPTALGAWARLTLQRNQGIIVFGCLGLLVIGGLVSIDVWFRNYPRRLPRSRPSRRPTPR